MNSNIHNHNNIYSKIIFTYQYFTLTLCPKYHDSVALWLESKLLKHVAFKTLVRNQ